MNPTENYKIRKGKIEDLTQVFSLVKELALYEKAPQEVTNTIKDMEKDGFGQNPVFSFFVAETDDNKIVGVSIFYIKYSTWKGKCIFLEDIIVNEKYRGKGIGKNLFETTINEAKLLSAKRLEFQVLNWNKSAIEFYKKFDVTFDDEWINVKLTENQIVNYHIQ